MHQSKILWGLSVVSIMLVGCAHKDVRPEPPFRTLFNNDLTNIRTCDSPYSPKGTPFNKTGLDGSVDETAGIGIDVHLLQPGMGWAPVWQSDIYPIEEHVEWYKQRYGGDLSGITRYLLSGGDVVEDFVQRCRKDHLVPFISMRMNDNHQLDYVDVTPEQVKENKKVRVPNSLTASKLYMEHPEYRFGDYYPIPDRGDMPLDKYIKKYSKKIRVNNQWNWILPEVRRFKYDFIKEICENYDIGGLELDFMRHPYLFKEDVPQEQRVAIMLEFIRSIRSLLDDTARDGQYRWLSVRVPFRTDVRGNYQYGDRGLKDIGADLPAWHAAGVDLFNLSCHYVMEQQSDLAAIHKLYPDLPLYLELSHTPQRYMPAKESESWDGARLSDRRMLTAPEEFYTAAHLVYSRGGKGVSFFNFVYYREHAAAKGSKASAQPPFEIFNILHDPRLVAEQPQHYYLSRFDYHDKRFSGVRPAGYDETYVLDMAPPIGGWKTDGRLRIQVDPAWGDAACSVYFNQALLETNSDISEPYPAPYPHGLGNARSLRAWTLPKSLLRDGLNEIRISMPDGLKNGQMVFLDIAVK